MMNLNTRYEYRRKQLKTIISRVATIALSVGLFWLFVGLFSLDSDNLSRGAGLLFAGWMLFPKSR